MSRCHQLLTSPWTVSLISAAVSFAALGLVIRVLFIDRNHKNQEYTASPRPTVSSTDCRDCLSILFAKSHNHRSRLHNQSLPCCAPSSEDLANVLTMEDNKFEKELQDNNKQDKSVHATPVSSHIHLLPSDTAMNFSNVSHVTVQLSTPTSKRNSNNHARGVIVHTDGIEILSSGLYYVYSSLYYKPNTDISSEHFPYQTWFHYVYRTRPNSPAISSVILRTVFTCCPSCSETKDSVYTGGVFYLEAGDIVQVCLSGQGIMGNDIIKESSFLGLYMLANV